MKASSSVHSTFCTELAILSLCCFLHTPLKYRVYDFATLHQMDIFPRTSAILTAFQNLYHIVDTQAETTINHDVTSVQVN